MRGRVLHEADPGWDAARRPWMSRFSETTPVTIAYPQDAEDVAAVLREAAALDVPIAVRSGGHDFAGRSTTEGLLLDVSDMNRIDVTGTRVTVGAGARLGEVYRRLGPTGRTLPGGCGATVGIAGLTLGGGLGVLGRTHGLLSDHLRSARVVTAAGHVVTCDEHTHPELFWALRGAGHGQLAIVTELVFDSVPAPDCVVFETTWTTAPARDLVAAWQEWSPDTVPELAASLLVDAPADPTVPVRTTLLGLAHDIGEETTTRLLQEFVDTVGHAPQHRYIGAMPWLDAKNKMADLAPGANLPALHSNSGFYAQRLPNEAIDELVSTFEGNRVAGEARELDLSPWGGAYNARPSDATAFPHRDARFLLKCSAAIETDRPAESTAPPWLASARRITAPYGSGGVYPNFPESDLTDPARSYWLDNAPRVAAIRSAWDPHRLLPSA